MCIRDSQERFHLGLEELCQDLVIDLVALILETTDLDAALNDVAVSYTHLRAHETVLDLVCRLLLEKKKNTNMKTVSLYTNQLIKTITSCQQVSKRHILSLS